MKTESGGSVEEPSKEVGSVQQEARTCPVCGRKFFATGYAPVARLCYRVIARRKSRADYIFLNPSGEKPGDFSNVRRLAYFDF